MRMLMPKTFIVFSSMAIVFTGCAVNQKYEPPAIEMPCQWQNAPDQSVCSLNDFCWWKALNDPVLDYLLQLGAKQNLDLSIAAAGIPAGCGGPQYESALEAYYNTWITVAAEIATNYIELRGLQQQLNLINKSIEIQNNTISLSKDLAEEGFTSEIDEKQGEERLSALEAQKPVLNLSIQKALNHLSLLLGYAPGTLNNCLSQPAPMPQMPSMPCIGTPSELLKRRPDIRKAERDIAVAAMAGCSEGQSQVLRARYEYQKTVMLALEETDNAMAALHSELDRNVYLADAMKASQSAYTFTLQLYEKGIRSYIDLSDSTRSLLDAENAYLQSQIRIMINYIELYKALGGGW